MRSITVATVAALVASATAAPQASTIRASANLGNATSDGYPPTATSVNTAQFPVESQVGFPGPTPTGVEPNAAQTAPAYPYNQGAAFAFPLVAPQPHSNDTSASSSSNSSLSQNQTMTGSGFDITKYWGSLSPWYSLRSADYGLPNANPLAPEGCSITQMMLLYRHGARYPTSGAAPSTFAQKLHNATLNGTVAFSGELSFLSSWTYNLGAELLTPFGRSQNFMLGVSYRELYGHLLNNFTAAGQIPVFRTQSQDRMVKTAHNFAAGFFGVPEYLDQVSIEILVQTPGVNNSGAHEVCPNSKIAARGSIGSSVSSRFATNAFNQTIARLQSQASGVTFTPTDAIAMLQLCSYETHALGYSSFCNLFTQADFLNYEYYYDLSFYYNNGPGSPVAAAQGKGFLDEWLARFTQQFPQPNSALNETFDNTSTYFPLNQSIYADATHETIVLDTLTAFNFTALFNGAPLNASHNDGKNSFVASKLVPFASHFTTQVLTCPAMSPTKQIRFLINDAVIPLNVSHPGCVSNPHGLCSFDNMVQVLQKRSNEINFNYDCYANYTASPGIDYNGRAPRMSMNAISRAQGKIIHEQRM